MSSSLVVSWREEGKFSFFVVDAVFAVPALLSFSLSFLAENERASVV